MKIIIVLNHPAQLHLFKNMYRILVKNGHQIYIFAKNKDVLLKLLHVEAIPHVAIKRSPINRSRKSYCIFLDLFWEMINKDLSLASFAREYNPDLMIGTDISISHVGHHLQVPSMVFNEDDYQINKSFCRLAYPFATHIVSPEVCSVGKYDVKKIPYRGYQKLAYLHPNQFTPNFEIVKSYLGSVERFFLLRLVSFTAGHDIEGKHAGLSKREIISIINKLEKVGKVYLSAETTLNNELKKYELKINPSHIHHFLAYADLLISDSQSMSVEAALLGTPSIRFNSFVGRISVLEELEHKYQLTTGIQNNDPAALHKKVNELLERQQKEEYALRRNIMIKDKIDLTPFIVWLIENYPESIRTIRNDSQYQMRFQ